MEKTLEEAKAELRKTLNTTGAIYQCCNQFTKIYRRKISCTSAYGLIVLSQKVSGEFHLEQKLCELDLLKTVRSDFPKLRYWGLIQALDGKREDGSSRNGYYIITEQGRMFAQNKISLPKYMHVYNSVALKNSGEFVKITDCLGEKFNYEELMGR